MVNAKATLLPETLMSSTRELWPRDEGRDTRAARDPKPDLPSPRYRRIPFTRSPGTYFCVQPLYAPRILLAFRNSLHAVSRERAVLTPVESVSIEVQRSNGRLDTFSSAIPFGQIGPGYIYGIFTSVHPVGVKGLASWRWTVVQSARGTPPFSGSSQQRNRRSGEGRRERETIEGLRRRGCGSLCALGVG